MAKVMGERVGVFTSNDKGGGSRQRWRGESVGGCALTPPITSHKPVKTAQKAVGERSSRALKAFEGFGCDAIRLDRSS